MLKNTLSRQYTIPYKLLISEKYLEILQVKGQDNLQNTSVNIDSYRS